MTVWLLYQGVYSSREVRGVYSSKELAQQEANKISNEGISIESVEVDNIRPLTIQTFEVLVELGGIIQKATKQDFIPDRYKNCIMYSLGWLSTAEYIIYLDAGTVDYALKQAQDIWAMVQATKETHFPFLERKVVRNKKSGILHYPGYNYLTYQIIYDPEQEEIIKSTP